MLPHVVYDTHDLLQQSLALTQDSWNHQSNYNGRCSLTEANLSLSGITEPPNLKPASKVIYKTNTNI